MTPGEIRHNGPVLGGIHGCLLLALVATTASAAREIRIAASPAVATWRDSITVTVSGVSATACGAPAVSLGPPRIGAHPYRIDVKLRESCAASGAAVYEPFAQQLRLAHLEPADYSLVVEDTDHTTHAASLPVKHPSTVELELVEPATSAGPAKVRIRGFGCPHQLEPPEVSGQVVTLGLATSCSLGYPAGIPSVFELEQAIGPLPVGEYEVRLVETTLSLARTKLVVAHEGACVPSDTTLCLQRRRFAVTASWVAPGQGEGHGPAHVLPLAGNDGSGLLWFFGPSNAELTVKAIDACALNARWWIFIASGSSVAHEVVVTDTTDGARRVYRSPAGSLPPLVSDVEAFDGCGGS
jgi:hypothetical protein